MAKNKDDKLVLEIIKRYGATIDLKESPYLIVEIIRQYGAKLGSLAAECQPPGGAPPPPPPPKTAEEIMLEIQARLAEIGTLTTSLNKTMGIKAISKKSGGKAKKTG